MKFNKNSLKVKVWLYLIIFSILILLFLWFFQIVSLKSYYEYSMKNEISKVVNKVKSKYSNEEYLNDLSHESGMCIEIIDTNVVRFVSIACTNVVNDLNRQRYKSLFIRDDLDSQGYEFKNPRYNNKTLMFGIKLEKGLYSFISVSLEPVDSTMNTLKEQLVYVSILIIMLSFVIAYFVSKKISNPIEKINESAKKMAKGEYNEVFVSDSGIDEINELSKTLDSTSRELAKTENLRKELLANVSHDLKTPLTMIKAYAELVRDFSYKDKEKRESNLAVIISETDRLNLLVNDILELSKIQSNNVSLDIESFNLDLFIKEIIKRYDIYVLNEGYTIIYEEIDDIYISADKKRLEQVFYNLINNALNYTGDDKKVIIKVIDKVDNIRVEIIDTGKGIKKEDIEYIWDKYYKADKTYSRTNKGTGIGLSIVKTILVAHNFNYGVMSKRNKGTTFYFEISK